MKTKWLYEDDLIEPVNPTDLSSGILFMSKPYNVTRGNIEVFEKLSKVKYELVNESWSIYKPGDQYIRYWVSFFTILLVCYAYYYQLNIKRDNYCHLFFICGIGLIVIVFLCVALIIYMAFRNVSTIKVMSKALKEKHNQLIVEMNWERRKMVLGDGNSTPEISHFDRIRLEGTVDYNCMDIYSPLYDMVDLPSVVTYIVFFLLLILYQLVRVVTSVGSSCGSK